MQYDALANITHKTQIEAPAGSGQFTTQLATTYDNPYSYAATPRAVARPEKLKP